MKTFARFLRWIGLRRLADKIDPPAQPAGGGGGGPKEPL
jgi:hypothetical protein